MFGRKLRRQRQGNDLARPIRSFEADSLEGAIQRALTGTQGVRHGVRPVPPSPPPGCQGPAGRRPFADRERSRWASSNIWWSWLFWYHGCLPPEALALLLDESRRSGDRSG